MKIDLDKVRTSAKNGTPLAIRSRTFPESSRPTLDGVLRVFLDELGQPGLFPSLTFCLTELVDNGRKASAKVPQPDGVQGLKVTFLIQNYVLLLNVANLAPTTDTERSRVDRQLARAWAGATALETLGGGLGSAEAPGLGLAAVVLVLRRLGLDSRSLDFLSTENETSVSLRIPMAKVKIESVSQVTEELASFVESIPPFPPNLRRLFRLLEDPEVEFSLLAAELALDPALTADLIKYINSASVHRHLAIEDLEAAIRIVGTQGLKDLMYPYGAHCILGTYLAKQKHLWENAAEVSRYAVAVAREFRFDWHEKGRTQIAGLLYNLGQIVLTFLHPDLSLKILDHCRRKGLGIQAFDALTQTVNPATLGALIAEKWNFPDDLILILRNQTQPQTSPESLRLATTAVYLAASLRSVDLGLLSYSQVSEKAMGLLGLDANRLEELHTRLLRERSGVLA